MKFVESVQDIESIKKYIKRDTDFMYHDDDELDRYFFLNIDFIIFYQKMWILSKVINFTIQFYVTLKSDIMIGLKNLTYRKTIFAFVIF